MAIGCHNEKNLIEKFNRYFCNIAKELMKILKNQSNSFHVFLVINLAIKVLQATKLRQWHKQYHGIKLQDKMVLQ